MLTIRVHHTPIKFFNYLIQFLPYDSCVPLQKPRFLQKFDNFLRQFNGSTTNTNIYIFRNLKNFHDVGYISSN